MATLALIIFSSSVDAGNALNGHSLKKLDVAGTEMVLFHLFLSKERLEVKSLNDMIGVSQKNGQVSLYIDYHNAHPAMKSALSKNSYVRDIKTLEGLISQSLSIQESKNSILVNLKN